MRSRHGDRQARYVKKLRVHEIREQRKDRIKKLQSICLTKNGELAQRSHGYERNTSKHVEIFSSTMTLIDLLKYYAFTFMQ